MNTTWAVLEVEEGHSLPKSPTAGTTTWEQQGSDDADDTSLLLGSMASTTSSPHTDPETPYSEVEEAKSTDRSALEKIAPSSPVTRILVGNSLRLKEMIDRIKSQSSPALYIDLEGVDLGKKGTITTLQIFVEFDSGSIAYIVDVWVLRRRAFTAPGHRYRSDTLQTILEDRSIPKLLWDCRMDAEALYWQYDITLASVVDVQLMEVVRRPDCRSKSHLGGYARAVKEDITLNAAEAEALSQTKAEVQALFVPRLGGAWRFLKRRPMSDRLLEYCVGDIRYMPMLYRRYAHDIAVLDLQNAYQISAEENVTPTVEDLRIMKPAALLGEIQGQRAKEVVEESRKRLKRSRAEGWDRMRDDMRISPWE